MKADSLPPGPLGGSGTGPAAAGAAVPVRAAVRRVSGTRRDLRGRGRGERERREGRSSI